MTYEIGDYDAAEFSPSEVTKDRHGIYRVYDGEQAYFTTDEAFALVAHAARALRRQVSVTFEVTAGGRRIQSLAHFPLLKAKGGV